MNGTRLFLIRKLIIWFRTQLLNLSCQWIGNENNEMFFHEFNAIKFRFSRSRTRENCSRSRALTMVIGIEAIRTNQWIYFANFACTFEATVEWIQHIFELRPNGLPRRKNICPAETKNYGCEIRAQLIQEKAHLHELDAGIERIIKAEEQQEVLLHGQKLCQLQKDRKKWAPSDQKIKPQRDKFYCQEKDVKKLAAVATRVALIYTITPTVNPLRCEEICSTSSALFSPLNASC